MRNQFLVTWLSSHQVTQFLSFLQTVGMTDQQANILFVAEVEKRPVLYNFKLPGYSKKDETERAWSEVGRTVNMTAAECKERWKNLRAVFVRNMKPSKGGSGARTKKAYYLLDAMQFTVPYIRALGATSGNVPSPLQQEEESEQFIDNDNSLTTNDSLSDISPSPQQPPSSVALPPSQHSTPRTQMYQQKEKRNLSELSTSQPKRTHPSTNDDVDKALFDYFEVRKRKKMVNSGPSNQKPKTEALKMFLLSMLPDLLKMTDEEVRLFKRKALDAVEDIFSTRTMIYPQVEFLSRSTTSSSQSSGVLSPNVDHVPDGTPH